VRLVFTNGTFDILHPGHIELFKVGASLGDRLIVATDTDEKIKQDKGPSKPINDLCYRMSMLQSIRYIDTVHYFDSRQELEDLIEMYSPDILLLGGDWKGGDVVGAEFAKEVRHLPRVGGYSSTKVIQTILRNYE
jgi:D-beta-D-heptose 7-phosphate kinase/D-beta-D-heptose 1-phosphate adenosyltransferase|tara:strand:+ start:613 stop:1017 length:405 start_codon:yes stop_codon:yes gene_type:complete